MPAVAVLAVLALPLLLTVPAALAETFDVAGSTNARLNLRVRHLASSTVWVIDGPVPVELTGSMTVERTPTGYTVSALAVSVADAPIVLNRTGAFGAPVVFTVASTAWHYGGPPFDVSFGNWTNVGSGYSDEVDSAFSLTYFGQTRNGATTWLPYGGGLSIGPNAGINADAGSIELTGFSVGWPDRQQDVYPNDSTFRIYEPVLEADSIVFVPEPTATAALVSALLCLAFLRFRYGDSRIALVPPA